MDEETEAVLDWYLEYTRSPTRNREQRTADFHRLRALPFLAVGVAPLKNHPDVLIAATQPVIIDWEGKRYNIGEFILLLQRTPQAHGVAVNFRFKNVTKAVTSSVGNTAHHPHILQTSDKFFGLVTGRMCIRQGQHTIYQALREARIPEAVMFLEKTLRTHTPQFATYASINHWPKMEQ